MNCQSCQDLPVALPWLNRSRRGCVPPCSPPLGGWDGSIARFASVFMVYSRSFSYVGDTIDRRSVAHDTSRITLAALGFAKPRTTPVMQCCAVALVPPCGVRKRLVTSFEQLCRHRNPRRPGDIVCSPLSLHRPIRRFSSLVTCHCHPCFHEHRPEEGRLLECRMTGENHGAFSSCSCCLGSLPLLSRRVAHQAMTTSRRDEREVAALSSRRIPRRFKIGGDIVARLISTLDGRGASAEEGCRPENASA